MALDSKQIQGFDDDLATLDRRLRAMPAPSDEESGRFCDTMLVLVNAAKDNYGKLRGALTKDDQVHMAWACRNLLEIAIFSKYVLLSPENAAEFAGDRLIDGLQIGVALRKLEEDARKARLSAPDGNHDGLQSQNDPFDADPIIEEFTKQLEDAGVSRRTPLRMNDLAKVVDLKDEYEAMNKLCSKLVHPTAWSLFTADVGSKRFSGASEIIFTCGALYASMVYGEFLPHLRKWGLHHRPQRAERLI
jgi:hypothetical protein